MALADDYLHRLKTPMEQSPVPREIRLNQIIRFITRLKLGIDDQDLDFFYYRL